MRALSKGNRLSASIRICGSVWPLILILLVLGFLLLIPTVTMELNGF